MKPLKNALADALHLTELRDLRHHGHQAGRTRTGTADRLGASGRTPADRRADRHADRRADRTFEHRTDRTPEQSTADRTGAPDRRTAECAKADCPMAEQRASRARTDRTGGERVRADRHGADRRKTDRFTERRTADRRKTAAACQQDPLFEFLRSLHHFLTAPQYPGPAGQPKRPANGVRSDTPKPAQPEGP